MTTRQWYLNSGTVRLWHRHTVKFGGFRSHLQVTKPLVTYPQEQYHHQEEVQYHHQEEVQYHHQEEVQYHHQEEEQSHEQEEEQYHHQEEEEKQHHQQMKTKVVTVVVMMKKLDVTKTLKIL